MRPTVLVAVWLVALGTVAGCGAADTVIEPPSAKSADALATSAGRGMEGPPERSANDAAWSVVSHRPGSELIEAVVAQGTTWNGRVVLRITVEGYEFGSGTTRCYAYTFRHSMSDGTPKSVHCPHGAAVTLTSPPPTPVLDQAANEKFTRIMQKLSPQQQRDPTAVRVILVKAFPAPLAVYTGFDMNGRLLAGVRAPDTCLAGGYDAHGRLVIDAGEGSRCSA